MVYCLNFHASYRCRHSGDCCRAGWPIPFDREEADRVRALRLVDAPAFVKADEAGVAALATRHPDGHCIFFEPHTRLCRIHRAAGESALPTTCRMFPRIILKDPRGTFLSMSHYCPTAAHRLLRAAERTEIVEAPDDLIPAGVLDGLDATDAWPPLLRPGVLMDHASYALWERRAIAVLAEPGLAPWDALDAIEAATMAVTRWSPGGEELPDVVNRSFAQASRRAPVAKVDAMLVDLVLRAVPAGLLHGARFGERRPPVVADLAVPYAAAINRWLAARLFGTWLAYQAIGLDAIVRYLRACLSVVVVELGRDGRLVDAIRRSDHLVVHLADSQRLADLCGTREMEIEVRN